MQSGKRNRRITIQSQTCSQDEFGQPVDTWNTAYQCWAAINVKNGKQIYSTAEFVAKTTLQIDVLWVASFVFTPNQRVIYIENSSGVTHTYQIESISNADQANKIVSLLVYELGANE